MPVQSLPIDAIFSELENIAKAQNSSFKDLQYTFLNIFQDYFSFNVLEIQTIQKTLIISQKSNVSDKILFIKFENPHSLSNIDFFHLSSSNLTHEIEDFISGSIKNLKDCFGVLFDAFSICFILRNNSWNISPRTPFSQSQLQSLLTYLSSLSRKSATAKGLINDFGMGSNTASKSIKSLLNRLHDQSSSITQSHFDHWKKIFNQFHSDLSVNQSFMDHVSRPYKIKNSFTLSELLFSIQTYLSILIKLIAYEISIRVTRLPISSPFKELDGKSIEKIKLFHSQLEKGDLFVSLSISNYLDGLDCFNWYINELDNSIAESFKQIYHTLGQYHFDRSKTMQDSYIDLFKELYQGLIHPKIRKYVGEVYTPLWLADFLIKNSGWNGDPTCTVVDPSCGSGIFVLQFIKYIRETSEGKIDNSQLIQLICNNIAGFDLNPLAVLIARTNVLLSIYDLIVQDPDSDCKSLNLPIFLLDILTFDQPGQSKLSIQIKPMDKFDFIIGNPPWINWEYLSDQKKFENNHLLTDYQLVSAYGMNSMLGEGKYDLSAIFVYKSIDCFLKDGGTLAFILTATLLKGLPAKGFRKYFFDKNSKRIYFKLIEIHDLTNFQPFPEASPKTAIMIFQKGSETSYPVNIFIWEKKGLIFPQESWNKVKDKILLQPKKAIPVLVNDPTSNLLVGNSLENLVQLQHSVFKKADYDAQEGCNTEGLNSAFWLQDIQLTNSGTLLFDNYTKSQKKKIQLNRDFPIEPDLVYPLLRSGNIDKWEYFIDTFIVFTPKYGDQTILDEKIFQKSYPLTFTYFQELKDLLETRASFKGKSKGLPFYIMYGKKSMQTRYKVVWNRMASEIRAVVTELVHHKMIGQKPPIPQETIAFIPVDSLEEAHFVCGILNSEIFSKLISMFQMKGSKGFGTPDILEKIYIPKFDPSQTTHQIISQLSKDIHELVASKLEISDKEMELDESVINVFGIHNSLENQEFPEYPR